MSGNNIPTGNKSFLYIIYLYNENDLSWLAHLVELCYTVTGWKTPK